MTSNAHSFAVEQRINVTGIETIKEIIVQWIDQKKFPEGIG